MAPRGGKRPGAGRRPGSRNKATDAQLGSLTEIAQSHTAEAIETLAAIMRKSESDAARVSAANSILDRGYGKPVQGVEHSGKGGGPMELTLLTDEQLASIATGRGIGAAPPAPRTNQLN